MLTGLVGRTFEAVCWSVCLTVCSQCNSKTNDSKVLVCPRSDMVLGLKGQGQGHSANKFIFHTNIQRIPVTQK